MRLTNMILTDFATAVAPVSTGSGEQTIRGSIVAVDPLNEKNVTVLLDGSRENTSATTTVEVEVNDRVMVLLKAHKAMVIGNISSPVLRTVTANKINAGAVNTQALTTDNITGENGWINFHSGTFNYGDGKLVWNGTKLTIDGTIESTDGTIGGWKISNGMLSKSCSLTIDNTLYDYDTLMYAPTSPVGGTAAFGVRRKEHGSSDSAEYQFLVQYNGKLVAKNADITGAINSGSGSIGGWTLSDSQIYKSITASGIEYRPLLNAPSDATSRSYAFGIARKENNVWSYPFAVHYDGEVEASNLKATGGSIAGWGLSNTQISKTIITGGVEYHPFINAPSDATSASYAFGVATRTNNGSDTPGNWTYPFLVKYDGSLGSTKGTIAGWTITADGFTANSGDTYVYTNGSCAFKGTNNTAFIADGQLSALKRGTAQVGALGPNLLQITDRASSVTELTREKLSGLSYISFLPNYDTSGHGGYIDFHYNQDTNWTNRIVAGNSIVYVRNSDSSTVTGNLRFRVLSGERDIPAIGSTTTGTERVSYTKCSSATGFGVYGEWKTNAFYWMYASMTTSDPKLKYDIRESKMDALALVNKLPLHEFTWKADDKHWDVGFLAPELYEIDPALVHRPDEKEDGDMWGVESFYLVGVLTKAIQELSQKVDDLERRVA